MTAHSFDWDKELPLETEDEVYRNLLRALQRKQGFGLFFVQCSSKAQWETIVANLCQDISQQRIQELHLEGEVTTLYDRINILWQQSSFDILVVEGLEASLYAYEDVQRLSGWNNQEIYHNSWKDVPKLLNHLNQQRERLRDAFPVRLVFLLPSFGVDYFIQRAADFLDWRSGLFRFPPDPNLIEQDIEKAIGGDYDRYFTLSQQERTGKILELKDLQHICSDSEKKIKLLFELGFLYIVEKDYKNAVVSYDKAVELNPDNNSAWFNRGVVLSGLGRKEEAIASYDKALEINPNKDSAWFQRGLILSDLSRKEEAIASYDKALEINPSNDSAWFRRGLTLSDLSRKEEAIASYDKALEINPSNDSAWFRRGLALSDLSRHKEAIASYDRAVKLNRNNGSACFQRGYALYKLGRHREAIASYDEALEINPDNDSVWFNRGISLYKLGRYREAIASYDEALEINPNKDSAWLQRGNTLHDLGRKEEAIASYDRALEINPNNDSAWLQRGDTLHDLGRKEEAIASYDRALEINPNNDSAWNNRGVSLYQLGRYKEAIASYDRAPAFDFALYGKAYCYGYLAIESLWQAITLNPLVSRILCHLRNVKSGCPTIRLADQIKVNWRKNKDTN